MMPEAFLDTGFGLIFGATPGISDASRLAKAAVRQSVESSPSLRRAKAEQAVAEALMETFNEAKAQGWDGYDAAPVSAATLSYTLQFLADLPSDVDMPEIGADSDGFIALDWDFGPRNVFSVRVGRDGTLYYGGLFGHSTYHGSETLKRGIPNTIAEGINRAIRTSQLAS